MLNMGEMAEEEIIRVSLRGYNNNDNGKSRAKALLMRGHGVPGVGTTSASAVEIEPDCDRSP